MDYLDRVSSREPEDRMAAFLMALAAERKRGAELAEKAREEFERALGESNWHQLVAEREHAKQNEQMFYEEIKKLALEQESKGLTLPKEVKVKTFKKVTLATLDKTTEWCLKNLPSAMKVDESVLSDAVKIGIVPSEIGWVEEEKRAQVASDLSRYE